MKKALLLLFTLTFVLASVASASVTRVTTMGENNDTLKDEHNIWLYPSTINAYPNVMAGVASEGSFYFAGGHWGLGQSVLGMYFSAEPAYLSFADGEGSFSVDNRINLFYGRQLGEMPFGVRLSLWGEGTRNEDEPVDSGNYDDSFRRIELAAGLTAMEGKLDIAADLAMSSFTLERNVQSPDDVDTYLAYDDLATDGSTEFGLRARYWHEYNDQWTLIPHASFRTGSQTVLEQNMAFGETEGEWAFFDQYEYDDSGTMVNFGVGTNYQASEKVMTVTDIGLMLNSYKYEETENPSPFETGTADVDTYEYKYRAIPYFKAGLEGDIKDWLGIRLGMVSEWNSYEQTEDHSFWVTPPRSNSRSSYDVSTRTYLGTAFHFGDLHIDTELNARFLNDGPYFITGRPQSSYYEGDAGWWATQVAFRYDFH